MAEEEKTVEPDAPPLGTGRIKAVHKDSKGKKSWNNLISQITPEKKIAHWTFGQVSWQH